MVNYDYIFAIEGDYISYQSLFGLLKNDSEVYKYLLERDYLKFSQNEGVAFNYVGVIAIGITIICVLPKYYKGFEINTTNKLKDFTSILKIFKKVGYSSQIPDLKNLFANDFSGFSEIIFCDKFLKDYLEYGLFNKSDRILSVDGDGETNWEQTVSGLDPVFSKNRPIYSSTLTSLTLLNELNVIKEIHKWVIVYSLHKYGKILDYDFDFNLDVVSDLSEIGSVDFLLNILRRELNIVYSDREILLLKRLIYFIKHVNNRNQRSFYLYGTSYFHVVWEKVCRFIFDDQYNQFSYLIPKPVWQNLVGNSVSKDTLVPDIISTIDNEESSFFVFDAKYYNIKYSYTPFDVVGQPGILDVGKQFLYEQAFNSVPYKFKYNCFLFPKIMNDVFEFIGVVRFSLFDNATIYNLFLSPPILFNSYLNNVRIGKANLSAIKKKFDDYNTSFRVSKTTLAEY